MIKKILLFFLILGSYIYSQSIYEPIYNTGIYNFLDRLSNRGIIKLFDDIRPVTRQNIAEKLLQISEQQNRLTGN